MDNTVETAILEVRQITFEDALALYDEQPHEAEPPRDIDEPQAMLLIK